MENNTVQELREGAWMTPMIRRYTMRIATHSEAY